MHTRQYALICIGAYRRDICPPKPCFGPGLVLVGWFRQVLPVSRGGVEEREGLAVAVCVGAPCTSALSATSLYAPTPPAAIYRFLPPHLRIGSHAITRRPQWYENLVHMSEMSS